MRSPLSTSCQSAGIAVLMICVAIGAAGIPGAVLAAPTEAKARYYLLSFHDEPVDVVARTVLGETLTYPYRIDPAVEGRVTLVVDGAFDEAGILGQFAVALAEQGIALDDDDGALVLRPMTGPAAAPRVVAEGPRPRPVYGRPAPASREGSPLPWFLAGLASGAAGLATALGLRDWRRHRRLPRRSVVAPLALGGPSDVDPLEALPPMPERTDAYSR